MGSGHFLVDAANQMAGIVVALLEEVPHVEGITVSVTSRPNNWRRRITRHCLYGVDLNPLAVNLAKLSLWLNCFAIEHKLTFLDHHVRCGNSLIGIRSLDQLASIPERKKESKKKKDPQRLLFDYNDLSSVLAEAAQSIASITQIDEDDTDTQKAVLDEVQETASNLRPLADLYTAYLMDAAISAENYKDFFECIARGKPITNSLNPALYEILESVGAYRDWHRFYHWPLEFPDVFGPDTMRGFSATIGNPPWDKVKPNSQEFFSTYIPNFRSFKRKKAGIEAENLMNNNPGIRLKWDNYCKLFDKTIIYFHQPITYKALGAGDVNTFKLFVEQCFEIIRTNGRIGMVLPSALYTDRGCQPLRKLLFKKSRVDFMYCFENRRAVLNIHRSFKFVLFGTQKGGITESFQCAFMEHSPERLPAIENAAISVHLSTIRNSSSSLSVLEYKTQSDVIICSKLYTHPTLINQKGILQGVFFSDEIHLTKASKAGIISVIEGSGRVLWEGKMINLFDSFFSQPTMWIGETSGREFLANKDWQSSNRFWYENYRLSYRRIAASTNERTILSSIIPQGVFSSYSLYNVLVDSGKKRVFYEAPSLQTQTFLLGIISSFIFDFVARLKFSINLVPSEVCEIPVPDLKSFDASVGCIVARGSRLICTIQDFAGLWETNFSKSWQSSIFWYPDSAPIDDYGPAHEQEIRRHLRNEASKLTTEWGSDCGVHDRLPDRRDTGDRAQLRAEIDAYVAHLYGLSRDDFAYILDTFPVLKKKEKKAFGEFMSKRKCLEEYDRIKTIMNAE